MTKNGTKIILNEAYFEGSQDSPKVCPVIVTFMIEVRVMFSDGLAIVITRLCKSRLSKLIVNGPEVN